MFDNNLFFRTGGVGSLTATETSAALTINETPIDGLALIVVIPKQSVGDTMQVTLRGSTDDTTYVDVLPIPVLASSTVAIATPEMLKGRFAGRMKYVKTVTTVAGTSPDFGAVQIFLGDRDWANNYTIAPATTLYNG